MADYLLVYSDTAVAINPNDNIKVSGRKIENSHRTRSGANYRYLWGVYDRVVVNVENLSSADMSIVNSWWSSTAPLVLYDINGVAVCSGYLTNTSKPIDQILAPYLDQFKGVIELEGY